VSVTREIVLNCEHQNQLPDIAAKILQHYKEKKLFVLVGDLGAGKTTLVKNIVSILGCTSGVSSPTFSIINEYKGKDERIYHIDLYRLKSKSEAEEIGIEEYLYSGAYCFIEWPQIIEELLPEEVVLIKIENTGADSRKIVLNLI